MIEKMVHTAKQTVKATVLALRMRVDWGWAWVFIAGFPAYGWVRPTEERFAMVVKVAGAAAAHIDSCQISA
ncbi:MAG: hypothetical protein AMXMBFR76_06550 [Pseudomonadota bacterium]